MSASLPPRSSRTRSAKLPARVIDVSGITPPLDEVAAMDAIARLREIEAR
jgi:hypothetical protein